MLISTQHEIGASYWMLTQVSLLFNLISPSALLGILVVLYSTRAYRTSCNIDYVRGGLWLQVGRQATVSAALLLCSFYGLVLAVVDGLLV